MVARLIFIFSLVTLIALALKKGFSPSQETTDRVPGYPAPVSLNHFKSVSDAEYLAKLPSAKDYALSFAPSSDPAPQIKMPKPAKRTVATKKRLHLAKRFSKRFVKR